jgi:hypothetical protein
MSKFNQNKKKSKTVDLGTVRNGQKGKYFAFDKSIKEIIIKRETVVGGEKIVEEVKLEPTDKGYFNAFISPVDDYIDFKVQNGWIDGSEGEQRLERLKEIGVTSVFTTKVIN